MFKKLKNRFFVVMAIVLVAFIALGTGLGNLTLTQGGELTSQSESKRSGR